MADLTYAYDITQDEAVDAPESWPLADSGLTAVGAAGLDPETLKLVDGVYLVTVGAKTSAVLAAACLTYAQSRGLGREGAGGEGTRVGANSMTPEVTTALVDGTWTPT